MEDLFVIKGDVLEREPEHRSAAPAAPAAPGAFPGAQPGLLSLRS